MAGENAAEHAHCGTGITAVEWTRRGFEDSASSGDFNRAAVFRNTVLSVTLREIGARMIYLLPPRSQCGYAAKRAGAVARRREIMESAGTAGDRGKHGVTMRDGLISGNMHHALNGACRTNNDGGIVGHRVQY